MELEKINTLRKQIMGEHYSPLTKDDMDRIMLQSHARILTIDDWSGTIAMTFVYVVESLTRKALVFEELVVDETSRGQGIGTKLVEKIIELGKGLRVDCIECCVKQDNAIAQKIYTKLGFKDRENLALRLWL